MVPPAVAPVWSCEGDGVGLAVVLGDSVLPGMTGTVAVVDKEGVVVVELVASAGLTLVVLPLWIQTPCFAS